MQGLVLLHQVADLSGGPDGCLVAFVSCTPGWFLVLRTTCGLSLFSFGLVLVFADANRSVR